MQQKITFCNSISNFSLCATTGEDSGRHSACHIHQSSYQRRVTTNSCSDNCRETGNEPTMTLVFEANGQTIFPILNTSRVCFIDVSPKIWRPKVQLSYQLPEYTSEYTSDICEGIFDFECFGKCVFRPKFTWDPGKREDLIMFDQDSHNKELVKNLNMNDSINNDIWDKITDMIKEFWDCFAKGRH